MKKFRVLALFGAITASFFMEPSSLQAAPSRWGILLGLDSGFSRLTTDLATSVDKNGFELAPKLLATFYPSSLVFDGGLGWFYHRVTGSSFPLLEETVTTRSLFFEFNARYRLSDAWSAGATTRTLFGTDFHFGANDLNSSSVAFLMGPQVTYEWNFDPWILRASVKGLIDLSLEDRQVWSALGSIEIGRIFTSESPKSSKVSLEGKDTVRVLIPLGDALYFGFKKVKPLPQSRAFLDRLASILKDPSASWDEVLIEGHTDSRGSQEYNLWLSKARADAIRQALVERGLDGAKIATQGFGFTRLKNPGTTPEAHQENRRVELKFKATKDPHKLMKLLEQL